MRERLFELIVAEIPDDIPVDCLPDVDAIVDHLLAEGIIVPPCKVGQTVFYCYETCDEEGNEKFTISEGEVVSFSLQEEGLWAYCRYKCGLTYWHIVEQDFCKTVFLTKEEAEKALAERREG